jgi:hypothetical protein
MNSIGAHQRVDDNALAVLEMPFDPIPMIDQIREAMPDMEAFCGEAA